MRRALSTIALCAALGCGGAKRTPEFMDEVRGYGEGIRWQRHGDAAARIAAPERAEFIAEREELEDDLRVGDWEIERVEWEVAGKRALVRVRWTWHLDSRGVVHKTVSSQEWELRGRQWVMVREQRERGEEMPGLAEPPEPPGEDGGKPAASPPSARSAVPRE